MLNPFSSEIVIFFIPGFWNWDAAIVSVSHCVADSVTCKLKNQKCYRQQKVRQPTIDGEANEAGEQKNRDDDRERKS